MGIFGWLFPPRPPVHVPAPEMPQWRDTMKDRIAQAIADNLPGARKEDMHYPVQAVLHAMREPTSAMLNAGLDQTDALWVEEIWQAMIDAALNEAGQ